MGCRVASINGSIPVSYTHLDVYKRQGKSLSVESEVEIIKNRGPGAIEIEKNTFLDVEYLDFTSHIDEMFAQVPVPTNRGHFNDLVRYYKRNKNWERYFYLKQNFPDLRPRDAATVHKSQGSTYDNVFIDLGNISTCHQADQAARMLYVACLLYTSRCV